MVVLYAMGKKFTQQQFETLSETIRSKSQSPEDAEEQIQYLREWDDPVFWAERHFYDPDTGEQPLKVRKAYYPFLRDGSRNRALRVGRQNGKCLSADTKVLLPDGRECTAEVLYERYGMGGVFPIIAYDSSNDAFVEDEATIECNGIKSMVRITVASGLMTTNTWNHPYLTHRDNQTSWIQGADIVVGDCVAIYSGIGVIYEPVTHVDVLPDASSYAVSVTSHHTLVADGFVTHNTVHSAVDILHTAYFEKNSIILVMVTQKKLMNRMLEIMSNYLRKSDIKSTFKMKGGKKAGTGDVEPTYDYEITVGDGFSHIRFFFLGNNPDKVRGQRATHIYIDEAEYYPDAAWPVITGIIKGRPDIKLTSTSTPCGIDGTWFFNFCKTCRDPKNTNGNEYHIKPDQDENWPEVERQLRMVIFDEISWQLEVMAEFVEARGAVYKKELINAAVERGYMNGTPISYDMVHAMLEYEQAPKFLGVDWNVPQNGVRLVEVALLWDGPVVTRNERIAYEQFTQTGAVKRILELYDVHRYAKIAIDHGYGATQQELLIQELARRGINPKDVLIAVDAGKKDKVEISYQDTELGFKRTRTVEIKTKQRLVEIVSKYLELNLTFMPSEDAQFDGLVKEARNFQRKKGTQDNYLYSDNTHSLSALQHALYVYDLHHDEVKRRAQTVFMPVTSSDLSDMIKQSAKRKQLTTTLQHSSFSSQHRSRTGGLDGRSSRTRL